MKEFEIWLKQLQYRFIAPENIPIQYGGLKREKDDEFSPQDNVLQQKLKGGALKHVEIQADKVIHCNSTILVGHKYCCMYIVDHIMIN